MGTKIVLEKLKTGNDLNRYFTKDMRMDDYMEIS